MPGSSSISRDAPAGAVLAQRPVLREGLIAGMIAAVAVAVWFLVLDLAQGRVLYTPAALGSALLLGTTSSENVQTTFGIIAIYTLIHCAAFIAIGLLAAALFTRAEKHPPVLLGAALLFVTLQTFAIGIIAAAAAWLFDVMPWWTIAAANAVAAVAMGVYLWRAHPLLRGHLRTNLEEEPRVLDTQRR